MIELNKIYCEDCLDTMLRMPDDFVGLVITSPPYNISNQSFNKSGKLYDVYSDNMDLKEYSVFIYNVLNELLRVTNKYIFFNFQILTKNKSVYLDIFKDFKHNIKDIFIWQKTPIPQIVKNKLATGYEFVLIMSDNSNMIYDDCDFPDNNYVPNIKKFKRYDEDNEHGATFSIDLVRFFCMNFSKPGDIIYDPFMGSGTTAIGAVKEKLEWIGSEISQNYVNLSYKRLQPYLSQKTLF